MKNPGISAQMRLRTAAQERRVSVELMNTRFVSERVLARLAASPWRDSFVLKGGHLFSLFEGDLIRPTRDLDLECIQPKLMGSIPEILARIMQMDAHGPEDGVLFDFQTAKPSRLVGDRVIGDRITLLAYIGTARTPLRIDVGYGSPIVPGAETRWFHSILAEFAPVRILALPRETVISEKLAPIVEHGPDTTRLQDVYDLWFLMGRYRMPGHALLNAIAATFAVRYAAQALRSEAARWLDFFSPQFTTPRNCRAWAEGFAKHSPIDHAPDLTGAVEELKAFAVPVLCAARDLRRSPGSWVPGQGWSRVPISSGPSSDEAGLPVYPNLSRS